MFLKLFFLFFYRRNYLFFFTLLSQKFVMRSTTEHKMFFSSRFWQFLSQWHVEKWLRCWMVLTVRKIWIKWKRTKKFLEIFLFWFQCFEMICHSHFSSLSSLEWKWNERNLRFLPMRTVAQTVGNIFASLLDETKTKDENENSLLRCGEWMILLCMTIDCHHLLI